jgi:hypothetical protein
MIHLGRLVIGCLVVRAGVQGKNPLLLLQIERVSLLFCEHDLINYRELALRSHYLVNVEEFEQLLFSDLNQLVLRRPTAADCGIHKAE